MILRRNKPKVAIVRGPGLSKWEMQSYEPLMEWFDIIAIGSTESGNDLEGIKFPIKKLLCPAQYFPNWSKMMPITINLTGDTQWLLGFDRAIAGVDLIHSGETWSGYTQQAVWAKRKGLVKALTMTVYENIPYLGDEFEKKHRNKRRAMREADRLMPVNEMARQSLLIEGADDKKISIVPQSVDTSVFVPGKNDKFKNIVLCIGRMVWEKGWYDIVPAAAFVKKVLPGVKFLCVGQGVELGNLKELVMREGLEDTVEFMGLVRYKNMSELFGLADLLLFPSLPTRIWNDQFGRVLIEAMAAGLPIVGTLSGGICDDTVGKGGGIFVQPQHFSGLGEAILKLYKDKALYKKISKRNRKVAVEKYNVDVVAKMVKQAWEKALG